MKISYQKLIKMLKKDILAEAVSLNIIAQINEQHDDEVKNNRQNVLQLMKIIRLIGQQGLALRGHDEHDDNSNPGNFLALVRHQFDLRPELEAFVNNSTFNYTSPTIQNEFIELMAKKVIKKIFYSVIIDETTDLSKLEQLSICVRYANGEFDMMSKHN